MLARIDQDLLDAGPRRSAVRERLCVATRTVRPLSELIRFVAAPDGGVVADLKRTLPGRGAWVTARRGVLAQAVRRGALQRALRGVKAAADLPAVTERLLERSVLDALSIARKAGQVAAGYAKVVTALASGPVAALIHARGAAEDGVRKIAAAANQQFGSGQPVPIIGTFASAELDLALARSNVIHAALLSGHASEAALARWRTLVHFRDGGAGERSGEEAGTIDPGLGS